VASIWSRSVTEDGIGLCIRLIFAREVGSSSITVCTDASAIVG
jgi:hypothetical protein